MTDEARLTYKFQPVAHKSFQGRYWRWLPNFDKMWIKHLVDDGHALMATRREEDKFTLLVKLVKRNEKSYRNN